MLNLSLVQNLLKDAQPGTSEHLIEENFDQIVALIEQEKTDEAASLIENAFTKGVPDIRLIVYYFYAHFTKLGIKSFVEIFPQFILMVKEQWDLLKPEERKDKHVQNSVNWLMSQILNKLKYCEKLNKSGKVNPIWKKSVLEVSLEESKHIVSVSKDFQHFIAEQWPKSSLRERALHLTKKVEEIGYLISQNEVNIEEEEDQKIVEKHEKKEEIAEEQEEKEPETFVPASEIVAVAVDSSPPTELSADHNLEQTSIKHEGIVPNEAGVEERAQFLKKLDDFSRKLAVFEGFISQNNYLKAAIVARDIDHLLETFDPLNYFPKFFAKYFSLFAKHVAALSEQYDKKDSLQVKTLEKLYRTDFDMFVDW